MSLLFILGVMLGLMISFFVSWISYHYAAKVVVIDGISREESMIIAAIETFYIALIYMISLMPLGFIFAGILSILLPYIMLKVLKNRLDTGWIVAIGAFVMVELVKAVFIVPLYLIR